MMRAIINKNYLAVLAMVLVAFVLLPTRPASADAVFVVNSTAVTQDNNIGDGICNTGATIAGSPECTLRAALQEANFTPAPDTINFNIVNTTTGVCEPNVTKTITIPNTNIDTTSYSNAFVYQSQQYYAAYYISRPVTINGYTQCGSAANSQAVGSNTVIRVELRGATGNARYVGLHFASGSSGSAVRGLSISNFGRGQISVVNSSNNTFAGNLIGLRASGAAGGGNVGIRFYTAQNNTIGGTSLADRNHIGSVGNDGIQMENGAAYNQVIGNYIGIGLNGTTPRGNSSDQLDIQLGAHHNWIGGIILDGQGNPVLDANGRVQADPNKRNIIGGGRGDGMELTHTTDTAYNHVVGNWIGLDAFGNALANGEDGINLEDHVNHNYVYQNIIVNNGSDGIVIWAAEENQIYDNWIGVHPDGRAMGNGTYINNGVPSNPYTNAVSKGSYGIHILSGSDDNLIERNNIAFNGQYGVYLSSETSYSVDEDGNPVGGGEDASARCANQRNRITQNSFYGNNDYNAIRLKEQSDGLCPLMQSFGMQPPTFVSANSNTLMATVNATQKIKDGNGVYQTVPCAGCTIEVYLNHTEVVNAEAGYGVQGKTFLASGVTDSSGEAIIFFNNLSSDAILVALTIGPYGNTSQFSNKVGHQPGQIDPPTCAGAPSATSLSVANTGDTVQLSWNSVSSTEFYRIYRSSTPYFTAAAPNYVGLVSTGTSYNDTDAMADTTSNYYLVQAVNKCLQEATASNSVGEVVIPMAPGWTMASFPVIPPTTSLNSLLADRLLGTGNPASADRIMIYDELTSQYDSAWYCAGECVAWGAPWANNWLKGDFSASTISLTPDSGFWVQNRTGATEYIKVVGNLASADRTAAVYDGWNMLGSSFPTARTPAQLGLPQTGTDNEATSNRILYWDVATQTYKTAWFCGGDCANWGPEFANKWLDSSFAPTDIVIQPGTGFWYQNRTNGNFTWTNPVTVN